MDLIITPTYLVLVSLIVFLALLLFSDTGRRKKEVEISDAILGPEDLKNHAIGIARNQIVKRSRRALNWLISRMNSNYRLILDAYRTLNEDVQKNLFVPPSAEWLLDNFYVIEEEFKDIKQNISGKGFARLPVLKSGYLKGYPRIFAIALEIVSHTDGKVDESTITGFIEAYQTQKILSSEELWALAIMIRISLIEKLRQICAKMLETRKQWRKAEEIGELANYKENSTKIKEEVLWFINEYFKNGGEIYSSFIEHLVKKLKKQGDKALSIIEFINEKLDDQGIKSDDVVAFEHQIQAALQVSIGNSLTSLKFVQSLNWNEVFESLSYVENILKRDPANVYIKMDFESKNYYRNAVDKLARACNVSETLIAIKALECANEGNINKENINKTTNIQGKEDIQGEGDTTGDSRERKEPSNHIGYYILGEGKNSLLSKINCKASRMQPLEDIVKKRPAVFYLGTIILVTLIITSLLTYYAWYSSVNMGIRTTISIIITIFTAIIIIIPASEIAIALVNFAVTRLFPPSLLPKLELEDGIPKEYSTMIIVPTLLPNEKRVKELLEQLEVHYLSNKEYNSYFALVGDFKDAASKNLPEDENIIKVAIEGIKELNSRYGEDISKDINIDINTNINTNINKENRNDKNQNGEGIKKKFFFFHRERQYNSVQKRWMGWERKRGAIVEVNELFRGSTKTSYKIVSCDLSEIPDVKYVITLDADTKLPVGTAKRLIGTLAHPMNNAVIDKKKGIVTAGYGILQPRININITSSNISPFTRTFAGQGGMDLYTTAVSDIYQDLFGEGIFTGKGIYELDVFQSILRKAIPENSILSHDLLEGCYIRAGLVTDIELIDGYPSRYNSFSMRLHRWVRGDWQLVPWLRRRVKDSQGKPVKNPLSTISKWKIIDNMRRSLINPSLLLLIIFGLLLLPKNGYVWLGFAALTITIHVIIQILFNLFTGHYFRYKQGKYAKGISPLKASLYQVLLNFIFIPYQAYLMFDAIIRTIIRLTFTRRNMLEWVTAADMEASLKNDAISFWKRMWMSSLIGGLLLLGTTVLRPELIIPALIISVSWAISFYVAYIISTPYVKEIKKLATEDIMLLRMLARKTWAYFEDLVTERDNFLPPDNYQEEPYKGIAHRTSPTNIGLLMASVVSAKDLGYISFTETGIWLDKIITTIEKMEKWEGHLYNWYNTNTLKILRPAYVSTVDSGNLVGYLMVIERAIKDYIDSNPINIDAAFGLRDTLNLVKEEIDGIENDYNIIFMEDELELYLNKNILQESIDIEEWTKLLDDIIITMKKFESQLISSRRLRSSLWWSRLLLMAEKFRSEITNILPLCKLSKYDDYSVNLGADDREFVEELLFKYLKNQKSKDLKITQLPIIYEQILNELEVYIKGSNKDYNMDSNKDNNMGSNKDNYMNSNKDNNIDSNKNSYIRSEKFTQFLIALTKDIKSAGTKINETINLYNGLAERISILLKNVKFKALYDKKRQLFYIGYDAEKNRYSKSYYDLLASEARQTSFIAIARGEVDQKHWLKLGRRLTMADDYRGLVSWTGTMFEYLMPLLIIKNYDNTLIDETYNFVVKTQKRYGRKRNIPWGVSESAYYAFDINLNYQYKAFGVPELGLKRGLVNDVVVAPYATILALNLAPEEVINNIHRLIEEGLYGIYGLYEAIDYTPSRLRTEQKRAIVKCFMAHHQGMSLLALNNFLKDNIMQTRFHKNPVIKSAELLLQERVPYKAILTKGYKVKLVPTKRVIMEGSRVIRRFGVPYGKFPHMHILSNSKYSTIITNGGSGYSRCNDIAVSRWKADLQEANGNFIYIRDIASNKVWSAAYDPLKTKPDKYRVVFSPDKAEFIRQDNNIETRTEIIISTEDNSEIRRVSLTNYNREPVVLESTSYMETVLTHQSEDIAHPAFSKLFITTEFNSQYNCILAERRPKSQKDKKIWALHLATVDGEIIGNIQYETDRGKFIGRTKNLANPQAMEQDQPLSNTTGFILDPIMSMRHRIKIEPGKTVRISYITAVSETYKEALEVAEKYNQVKSIERAFELAWTRSQIESSYLGFKSDEIELYLKMLPHILIPGPLKRKWESVILKNKKGQSGLWIFGISGDVPIILLYIDKKEDIEFVHKLIKGHEYWYMKGIEVDLVIITEDEGGYLQPLYNLVKDTVASSHARELLGRKGGVFIINKNQITDEDIALLYDASRIIFKGDLGPLEEQLEWEKGGVIHELPNKEDYDDNKSNAGNVDSIDNSDNIKISQEYLNEYNYKIDNLFSNNDLPSINEMCLKYFNGLGGFDNNSNEYVIFLKNKQYTPAPWINVISNENFGFIISESGGGYTWAENSRENKLTPWSNDPVTDNTGEAIYIRDDNTGEYWNITPLPIRSEKSYTIKHGYGYTSFEHSEEAIEQKLIQFVPVDDSVKISLITLENMLDIERKLSLFYYIKPVLGVHEKNTLQYITTNAEKETGILTIENSFNAEFPNRIAFIDTSISERHYTGDFMEFIGISGSLQEPAAMKKKVLSGTTGSGFYPCAAIQISVKLNPGEKKELVFLLGQGKYMEDVLNISRKYRIIDNVKREFKKVTELWEEKLGVIQVCTSDETMNIVLNGWLLYQVISCRLWARSAFYQSGGAFGFRDQLQDVMTLIYAWPELTRKQIMLHASRQFLEGDVQHWWHQESGKGIRSKYSDDLLWLAYVTADYIICTGDWSILEEEIPYIEGELLEENQSEIYDMPRISEIKGTVYEHCIKAIDKALQFGEHGIPLIGSGDWNDGMNTVGNEGKGESVWLGWFLCTVMSNFIPLCEKVNDKERAKEYKIAISKITEAIEKNAWDGSWYLRAFFDDGTPLGSSQNNECRIDSIAQSWAAISDLGDKQRTKEALNAVENHLINKDEGIIKLFTPPFDKGSLEPGYIKGYVPGIRENGGQYTHAALWVILAFAKMGDGDKAHELFSMINPINHSRSHIEAARYKTEPYVLAADVYAVHPNTGRGGWTWYTGGAGWMYRIGIEHILGIKRRGESILLEPCIPESWSTYTVRYKYGKSEYEIYVMNPQNINQGIRKVMLDGNEIIGNILKLRDDGKRHFVEVIMGRD